jgi:hypothetical protein
MMTARMMRATMSGISVERLRGAAVVALIVGVCSCVR